MEYIFHEKQEGSLCAVHCINSLLQGAYYTPVELASLAQRMDEEERMRMAESGVESDSYRRFVQEPSGNMDDSGYFSVQVISSALDVWGLELIPYSTTGPSSANRAKPLEMTAFICNYRDHWLTVRKLGRQWFNLNSLLSGPQLISDTYLEIFLAQLQQEGYSIFAVCGALPHCEADERLKITPAVPVKQQPKKGASTSTAPPVVTINDDSEDTELQTALRLSTGGEEDGDLKRALELSMEEGDKSDPALQHVLALSRSEIKPAELKEEEDEDVLLSRAMELSRSVLEKPKDPPQNSASQQSFHTALSQGSSSSTTSQTPVNPEEIRRKRLAYLDRQVAGGKR